VERIGIGCSHHIASFLPLHVCKEVAAINGSHSRFLLWAAPSLLAMICSFPVISDRKLPKLARKEDAS